ncbi:MAG: lipoate--protein ligase family protein [Firmicutes bacterium]|nr:lipoate--protein ligase family protein [Bacillota bacterium]
MIGRLLPWMRGSAAWNMAVDEAVLVSYSMGKSPMTLRFYGWTPSALSFGCFQNPPSVQKRAFYREKGIAWVKRPSGGRAVFHHDELTYSLVTGARDGFHGPVLTDYQRIAHGLKKGFSLLGLQVELAEAPQRSVSLPSSACFASRSWYELTCSGRKLVGSAQVRRAHSLLQHGSIPFTFDAGVLLNLLEDSSPSPIEIAELQQSIIGLEEALGFYPERQTIISVLQRGLSDELGVEWQEMPLTAEEVKIAQRLAREKYANPAWNETRGLRSWENGVKNKEMEVESV